MLSIHEQDQLKRLLEIIGTEEIEKREIQLDVSQRLRDEKGRFLPSESPLNQTEEPLPGRSIKVVKVKGSYGTYVIKECRLSEEARYVLYAACSIIALALIF